ncbi:MAG: DNRLRE domain-containing protein [Bacteroidota bacterium]
MPKLFISVLILSLVSQVHAQSSSLVHLGEANKLEYTLYANRGEDLYINQIPDFSYAGYQFGGVELPHVENKIILEALPGDNRAYLQQAIDGLSSFPPDERGIRGAILLKSGMYECSGPLYIRTSGIVMRGEGQLSPSEGGTEIQATARYQHELINVEGIELSSPETYAHIDTILVPKRLIQDFDHDGKDDTIDGSRWLRADIGTGVENDLETGASTSLKITTHSDEFVQYDSKEGAAKPYLEIICRPAGKESDSVFTVYPDDDAYIRGGEFASMNAGEESMLIVKNNGYNHQQTREVYLRFTVPVFNGQLRSAELVLWCDDAGDYADVEHYVSHFSNLDWDEMSITYDNQPRPGTITGRILNQEVPVGSSSFRIENVSLFQAGDSVMVIRTPNQQWIDDIGMNEYGWLPDDFILEFERVITGIEGDMVYLDVPMVQSISLKYGGGEVLHRYSGSRISQCGIEDLLLSSVFIHEEDEEHAWTAVHLKETENCWVRNVTARYFGYGCVRMENAYKTTVENCAMLDPASLTLGDRKYSFDITKGSFNLVQRCYTKGGRHDFVTDAKVTGPNVFLDCLSDQTLEDIGPHHRYATGILFDNIRGGDIRVQNRKDAGTSHGWSGAQTMFWNLEAPFHEIKVESPVGAMNWGIGCFGGTIAGDGFWEQWGSPVLPRSLYLQQLKDRLGSEAVGNVTIPSQNSDYFYDILRTWRGNGDLESVTGITDPQNVSAGILVYPNPTDGWLYIDLKDGITARLLRVLDQTGRSVLVKEINDHTSFGVFLGMKPGIYFMEIHTDTGLVNQKIILR